jgi:hypothetical protein
MCLIFCDTKVDAASMGTVFTYQGRLIDFNEPADGVYDLRFRLYASESDSDQVGSDEYVYDVNVVDGYFTVELDFGSSPFYGSARWLEIGVRPEYGIVYTHLMPRVEMTPTPYALFASRVRAPLVLTAHTDAEDAIIDANNIGDGSGIFGAHSSSGNYGKLGKSDCGVYGMHFSSGKYGELGKSDCGVYGANPPIGNYGKLGTATYGVYGLSYDNIGVHGKSEADAKVGVWGLATGISSHGVDGQATGVGSIGVHGESTGEDGEGVRGRATASGAIGVHGTGGIGVQGDGGIGVYGEGSQIGVKGAGGEYCFYAVPPDGNSIAYGVSSSIRWKTDVRPIEDPLGMIMCMRGIYFKWDEAHGGGQDVGMVAEEVGNVLPQIVQYEKDGIYASGMDYSRLTPLLVEAVKELKAENDELRQKLEAIERRTEETPEMPF